MTLATSCKTLWLVITCAMQALRRIVGAPKRIQPFYLTLQNDEGRPSCSREHKSTLLQEGITTIPCKGGATWLPSNLHLKR